MRIDCVALVCLALVSAGCDLKKNLHEAFTVPTYEYDPPTCTSLLYIVALVDCEVDGFANSCDYITNLVPEPDATPPQVQMKVGQAARIRLSTVNATPAGCAGGPRHEGEVSFRSANPAVAQVEPTGIVGMATLRALHVGDSQIYADHVSTPSGLVRVPLAYCADYSSCDPIELMLRVRAD